MPLVLCGVGLLLAYKNDKNYPIFWRSGVMGCNTGAWELLVYYLDGVAAWEVQNITRTVGLATTSSAILTATLAVVKRTLGSFTTL